MLVGARELMLLAAWKHNALTRFIEPAKYSTLQHSNLEDHGQEACNGPAIREAVTGAMWKHKALQPGAQAMKLDLTSSPTFPPEKSSSSITTSPSINLPRPLSRQICSAIKQWRGLATNAVAILSGRKRNLGTDYGATRR